MPRVRPQVSVTLPARDISAFQAWADEEEVSRSELIRNLLKQVLAERRRQAIPQMPVVLPEVPEVAA
jgi:metal-responsive CopG/Arc/MetJ family transcriptional regulator